jgi:hypothetical protein
MLKQRRFAMIAVLHFTMLVITTLFAAGAAALVNWLLLRATFQLMRPATAGRALTAGPKILLGPTRASNQFR